MNGSGQRLTYAFARFRVDAQHRVVTRDNGESVPLAPKVFDTLLYFVERPGELLDKRVLLDAIWPKVVVEENNLSQAISTLRRVLGEHPGDHRFIVTEPGRGYRFVASVSIEAERPAEAVPAETVVPRAAAVPLETPCAAPLGGAEREVSKAAPRGGARVSSERPRYRIAAVGLGTGAMVLAGAVAAGLYWFFGPYADVRWFREQAIPTIEEHLDAGNFETAYSVARQAKARVPKAGELAELWPRFSWQVSIASDPAGATVSRRAYDEPNSEWEPLGRTPLAGIPIPFGLSVLRFELDDHPPLERVLGGGVTVTAALPNRGADPEMRSFVGPETYVLDTAETLPEGKVRVSGWSQTLDGDLVEFRDYFLGRYEVTNAEFKAFVDAGGYRNKSLWDPVVVDGVTVAWSEVMERFKDRTGRTGPSTWEAGDYPQGQDDFPVSGISWYEASAYARFVGQELPSVHHWWHGLAPAMLAWQLPASNFGAGPVAVGTRHAMGWSGTFDQLGNVREWTASARGDQRFILGGGWDDTYDFASFPNVIASPLDRSATNGLRLAITADEAAVAARAHAPLPPVDYPPQPPPVSDEVYAAYGRIFTYEPTGLNATIEATDVTRLWRRQRISFAAAYRGERMVLYLYLPAAGTPPYQSVIYWPGRAAVSLDSIDDYSTYLDFIVKSGRAVVFPVFEGTFERGDRSPLPSFDSTAYRDGVVERVKDLRRSIDYLATRPDVDSNGIAFYGHSWGGLEGPTALAQEPRIGVAVIEVGILPSVRPHPEVDPHNALPRVRVPTLFFSGQFDSVAPPALSQRYFDLIGSADKKQVNEPGGHFVPRTKLIAETLEWLDTHLGTPGQ